MPASSRPLPLASKAHGAANSLETLPEPLHVTIAQARHRLHAEPQCANGFADLNARARQQRGAHADNCAGAHDVALLPYLEVAVAVAGHMRKAGRAAVYDCAALEAGQVVVLQSCIFQTSVKHDSIWGLGLCCGLPLHRSGSWPGRGPARAYSRPHRGMTARSAILKALCGQSKYWPMPTATST